MGEFVASIEHSKAKSVSATVLNKQRQSEKNDRKFESINQNHLAWLASRRSKNDRLAGV